MDRSEWMVSKGATADGATDHAIYVVIRGKRHVIGEAFGRSSQVEFHDSKKNADLMAAAPDLLVALEMVLASIYLDVDGHQWRTCNQPSCVMARAAIIKAKGSL